MFGFGDIAYVYDGSLQGFLCCVYESVYTGVMPFDILTQDGCMTLMETHYIVTNEERAERVRASIPAKISQTAWELVRTLFCSCLAQKELKTLQFLLRGYKEGGAILEKLGDPLISTLLGAERHLFSEAHKLKGFIRFEELENGGLVTAITPKNFVLPFIAGHFKMRYSNYNYIIFDKTHQAALVRQDGHSDIIHVENIEFPTVSAEEAMYQDLWKQFYNTVAIAGRDNPRCRMTHMPKRYWVNMTEVKDAL
ncbi:MAG: TIGR03915 family putative DNA repair protein [Clostridia bacterium]|nr:TIGR03915 family putative DNA repair protein [Clostridia bacterium]